MDIKQNPFSLYDFLGYFVPGATFILFICYVNLISGADIVLIDKYVKYINFKKTDFFISSILASYILGHVISFVSSVTIEKYSVWRYGYPSKYLFGKSAEKIFSISKYGKRKTFLRVLTVVFILPVTIFDYFLGYFFDIENLRTNKLDKALIEISTRRMSYFINREHGFLFVKDREETGSAYQIEFDDCNLFLLIYHYVVEKSQGHNQKLQNYVALYGFCRAICFVFISVFWLLLFACELNKTSTIVSLLSCVLLSYIMFLAFMKFYRRFSLESIMALNVIYTKQD